MANNKFKVRNGLFSNNITLSDDVENSVSEMTISMSGSDLIILDETAGVERLFIDSSGKVGIGTTSPGDYNSAFNNLVVAGAGDSGITIASGTSSEGSIAFADGTSGADTFRGWINYNHFSNFMRFSTNNEERLRITSTGEIVTGGLTSSTGQLHLYKADATGGKLVLQSQVASDATAKITMMSRLLDNTNKNAYIEAYRGNINFGGDAGYGKVGIGTDAPQTLLDVEGAANTELLRVGISANENSTLLISPFTASATNGLQTITSGSQFGTLIQGALNGKLVLATRDNDTSDSIDFVSGGGDWTADNIYDTTIATFRSDGNVGIGTNTPDYALDVYDVGEAWIRADSSTTTESTANSGLRFAHGGVNHGVLYHRGSDDALLYFDNIAASTRFLIDSSGKVGIGTNAPATPLHIYSSVGAGVTKDMLTLQTQRSDFGSGGSSILFFDTESPPSTSGGNSSSRGRIKAYTENADEFQTDFRFSLSDRSDSAITSISANTTDITVVHVASVGLGVEVGDYVTIQSTTNFNEDFVVTGVDSNTQFTIAATGYDAFAEETSGNIAKSETFDRMVITGAGNVGIGTDLPAAKLHIENGDMRIEKDTKATIGFRGHTTGSTALAFRDSNAGIDRMTIDASGNLLVGVTSTTLTGGSLTLPNSGIIAFHDAGGAARNVLQFVSGNIKHGAAGSGVTTQSFYTSNTLAATIDSDGKILIGTTHNSVYNSSTQAHAGALIDGVNDNIQVARWEGTPLFVNRMGTPDGALVDFRKDGLPVGSIGTVNGDMYIGTGDTALFFSDASNLIMPYNPAIGPADGLLNLGRDTNRFKDLHLSGTNYSNGLTINQSQPYTPAHFKAAGGAGGPTDVLTIETYRTDVDLAFTGGSIVFVNSDGNSAGQARIKVGSTNDPTPATNPIGLDGEQYQSFIFETGVGASSVISNIDGNATTITVTHDTVSLVAGQRIAINEGTYAGSYTIDTVLSNTQFTIADTAHDLAADTTPRVLLFANPRDSMIIRADGNVGIGTNTPERALHVVGGIHLPNNNIISWDQADGTLRNAIYVDAADDMIIGDTNFDDIYFSTGQKTKTVVIKQTTGNVGIGTPSPSFKLHVSHDGENDASFIGGILVENTGTPITGEANLAFKNQDTGSNYWFTGLNQDTNYALSYGPNFGDLYNLFTLTSGGNLGVGGDPDPDERLVVTGSANGGSTAIVVQNEYSLASSVDESTDLQFRFYSAQTDNYTSGAQIRSRKTEDWMTTATASAELVFYTREDNVLAPKMTILPSGNVGIGTNTPEKNLSIGNSQAEGIQFNFDTTNEYRNQILNYWNTSADSRMDFNVARASGATPSTIMSVGYNSNVGIGTTTPASTLDLTNGTDTAERAIRIQNDTVTLLTGVEGSAGNRFLGSAVGNAFFGTTGAHGLELGTNNNVRMVIDSAGFVGIGTTSPKQKVHSTNGFYTTGGIASPGTPPYTSYSGASFDWFDGYARLASWGADATTRGGYSFIQMQSDGESQQTAMTIDASGKVIISDSGSARANYGTNQTPQLQIEGNDSETGSMGVVRNSNDINPAYLYLGKTRSTTNGVATPTIVQDNDVIGSVVFTASDGVVLQNAARISALVDGAPTAGTVPGELLFYVGDNGTNLGLRIEASSNATFAGDVIISGDLFITGASTSVNVEDLNVEQGEITLNYGTGDTSAAANGAGIRIQDAVDASTDATILWNATSDKFEFSHGIISAGPITGSNLSGINTGDETLASINALDITEVGTITSGVWNGTVIDPAYLGTYSETSFSSTTSSGNLEILTFEDGPLDCILTNGVYSFEIKAVPRYGILSVETNFNDTADSSFNLDAISIIEDASGFPTVHSLVISIYRNDFWTLLVNEKINSSVTTFASPGTPPTPNGSTINYLSESFLPATTGQVDYGYNVISDAIFKGGIVASGGISGLTLANGGISGTNYDISGVNQLTIADPGEGIVFSSGTSGDMSLAIVDDLSDNILRYSGTNAVFDVQGDITASGDVIINNARVSLPYLASKKIGPLSAVALQAKRFTIGRIYYTPAHWSDQWTAVRLNCQMTQYSQGSVEYVIYGYYSGAGNNPLEIYVNEITGHNDLSATVPHKFKISLGSQIDSGWDHSSSGDVFYQDIYVDVDYYNSWTIEATVDSDVLSNTNAVSGDEWKVVLYDSPASANISTFSDTKTVFKNYNVEFNGDITASGNITGTWQGTAIASAYLDADTAHLSGTQTFTGNKTFSGGLGVSSTSPTFIINDSDATNATNQVGYISFQRQSAEKAWIGYGSSSTDNFTIKNTEGAVTIDSNVDVIGTLTATSKSFDIEHPTKEGMRLRYGSLEGPENGVYVRGRMDGEQVIQLPDYWLGLVHEDTITVSLTSIGPGSVWVESIENNTITVGGSEKFFYHVFAERKDIEKLTVEYDV